LRALGIPTVVLATLYAACADPPKKSHKGAGAGTAGTSIAEAGASEDGGTNASGGAGGSSSAGGKDSAGMAGEPDAEGGMGGDAGSGGSAGTSDTPLDACAGLNIGQSKMPSPPTTGVAKPSGAVGGLKVIDWAGFKGALSYTFDDSLQSQVAHYDELNAVGVHMTFYLVNSNQGSNAIWLKAVADGHELGNHTVNHCNANGSGCINSATFLGVAAELDNNTAFLKSKAGVSDVYTFAEPFGDLGWSDAASQRFLVARGVSDRPGALPNDSTPPFDLPCHVSNEGEKAVGGFNSISDDVRAKGSWRTILMHNVDPAIADYGYHPVQIAEAVAAMTYTKSLGDVWADTVVAVGSYWRAQKAFSTVPPKSVGNDTVYTWTLPAHFPPGMYLRATVTGGTLKQCGSELSWDDHGYYEINLDAGSVTISP